MMMIPTNSRKHQNQGVWWWMMVIEHESDDAFFSRTLMCPTTGISYQNPEPNSILV
jgi:hypothetical protein